MRRETDYAVQGKGHQWLIGDPDEPCDHCGLSYGDWIDQAIGSTCPKRCYHGGKIEDCNSCNRTTGVTEKEYQAISCEHGNRKIDCPTCAENLAPDAEDTQPSTPEANTRKHDPPNCGCSVYDRCTFSDAKVPMIAGAIIGSAQDIVERTTQPPPTNVQILRASHEMAYLRGFRHSVGDSPTSPGETYAAYGQGYRAGTAAILLAMVAASAAADDAVNG